MTGDYTKVPLRAGERWTGARMQQGRVLLDHEWNLNLDADARDARALARAVIGPTGVVADAYDFSVYLQYGPPHDLIVQPGRLWVDGLVALAPDEVRYNAQEGVPPLPDGGRALVYLDVFPEHLQPAEAWADLVDPALDPVDSAARTRVGWRLRVGPAPTGDCQDDLDALRLLPVSNGWLTIGRQGPVVAADPCAPPGDPLEVVPDGLFRVEVLDGGTVAEARFAWSADNGASAVRILQFAGAAVTLPPSPSVKFAKGDLVEVSWLARRADRLDHGPLYTVVDTQGTGSGQRVVLDAAVRAPAGAAGIALRRWDGQAVGAATPVKALLHGVDLGLFFVGTDYVGGSTAVAADADVARTRARYLAGDWWGAALRSGSGIGIEPRDQAPPDGIDHRAAPLAVIDLDQGYLEHDCRVPFLPLTEVSRASTCTVTAFPGDDLQKAVDRLPYQGGELCLAAGEFLIETPIRVTDRQRIVVTGVGPATVLTTPHETALLFETCTEVEVRNLRAEGGGAVSQSALNGALTFIGCSDVRVVDCDLSCPGGDALRQTCVTVRADEAHQFPSQRVHIAGNRCRVGAWQAGILISDADESTVTGNEVRTPLESTSGDLWRGSLPSALRRLLSRPVDQLLAPGGLFTPPDAGDATPAGPRRPREGALSPDPANPTGVASRRGSRRPAVGLPDLLKAVDRHGIDTATRPLERRRALRTAVGALLDTLPPAAAGGREPIVLPGDLGQVLDGLKLAYSDSGSVGIEVVGRRAYTVRIGGNLVEGVVRGIHVGTSDGTLGGGGSTRRHSSAPLIAAREVLITGNVVHLRVPWYHQRHRHAVYVGNAESVHIADTTATLHTPGAPTLVDGARTRLRADGQEGWDVEAIRLWGEYGSYVRVRDSNLTGYSVGVRMRATNPPDEQQSRHILWLISETLARYSAIPVNAPYAVVQNAVIGW